MFLERYLSGDCVAVWNELNAIGETVRTPEYREDAAAVCQETMRRVKVNVELLVLNLTNHGYKFGVRPRFSRVGGLFGLVFQLLGRPKFVEEPIGGFRGPITMPPPNVARRIQELETMAGHLPMSLCAFWESVGAVDFRGWHPSLPHHDNDPLMVCSIEDSLHEARDLCQDDDGQVGGLVLAPDWITKDGVRGNVYGISPPCSGIDCVFHGPPNDEPMMFVEYLRHAMKWCGFPGLAAIPHSFHTELHQLREALLPF